MTTQQVQARRHAVPTPIAAGLVGAVLVATAFGGGILAGRALTPAGATVAEQLGTGNRLLVAGSAGGGIEYRGLPYAALAAQPGANRLLVAGSAGGGIEYRGIPSAARP